MLDSRLDMEMQNEVQLSCNITSIQNMGDLTKENRSQQKELKIFKVGTIYSIEICKFCSIIHYKTNTLQSESVN